MTIKPLLFSLGLLLCLSIGTLEATAQDKSNEFLIESSDLKELKKYKWKNVHKYFKDFDKKATVIVRVKYTNPSSDEEKRGKVDNFDISFSGERRNVDDLTDKMASLIDLFYNKF